MKKILFVFLITIISFNAFAYDHLYSVSGEDENGNQVEGTIYSINGQKSVDGEITDENGNEHDFDGQWNGYGQISGETDEGVSVDLNTD